MKLIPIPERMAQLERDHRGYPVPFIVWRDSDGRPHFTINDALKQQFALQADLCGICGQGLLRGRWFIGGLESAFDPRGAFADGPVHEECGEYALQVCPYLAAPNYAKRINGKTVAPAKRAKRILFNDPTMNPDRPSCFVAIHTRGHLVTENGYLRPKRPYLGATIWSHGVCEARLSRSGWRRFRLLRLREARGCWFESDPGAQAFGSSKAMIGGCSPWWIRPL